tara:strand:+ start:450 stop:641 length:192 start_codon:yes stop_codon:yes gene_type:complete
MYTFDELLYAVVGASSLIYPLCVAATFNVVTLEGVAILDVKMALCSGGILSSHLIADQQYDVR